MDEYSFSYPKQCTKCASTAKGRLSLSVKPYLWEAGKLRVMLIGQDPTIFSRSRSVERVLDRDKKNGQISRWLGGIFGEDSFYSSTIYATNLVKCSFSKPPSTTEEGSLKFLQPYFQNCKDYLVKELSEFKPALVLTFGEPTHKLFVTILDSPHDIPDSMQGAFKGRFLKAKLQGLEFDYSPCLHMSTFRVAEVYGDAVKRFKEGIRAYLGKAIHSDS